MSTLRLLGLFLESRTVKFPVENLSLKDEDAPSEARDGRTVCRIREASGITQNQREGKAEVKAETRRRCRETSLLRTWRKCESPERSAATAVLISESGVTATEAPMECLAQKSSI